MEENFYLDFNNQKIFLRLTWPKNQGVFPALIFIHGSTSNHHSFDFLVENLKEKFVCLSFDHLGCGKSSGQFEEFTLEDRLEQAKFVLKFLLEKEFVGKENISFIGSSMGAHIACRLTEFFSPKNLILRAPACYRKDYERVKMIPKWLPWDKENKFWPQKPSLALESLRKFNGRLLIIESEKDEVIPKSLINDFFNTAVNVSQKKVEVIKNASHKISDKKQFLDEFLKLVREFLNQ
jgi:esterase/lipase